MESWYLLSIHKSSMMVFLMLLVFIVGGTLGGVYREDERKTLLAIKTSIQEASDLINDDHLLPSWVDDNGGEYCDWERIKCDTTSRYVTHLSFSHILYSVEQEDRYDYYESLHESRMMVWPLNFSLFLHFKELTSLDLSWSYIGNTGLEGLADLKKLEILNLSTNFIETNILPSLSELTSLKTLDLSYMNLNQYEGLDYSPAHDISEISSLENLEVLDLSGFGFYGSLQMQVASALSKLEVLNARGNFFNQSFVASLSVLPSLKALDLSWNRLSGPFPFQELSHLTYLKKLDLSGNSLNVTPSFQGCKSLVRLESLESVSLGNNYFNKSIISCLSFLPSLKFLDLHSSRDFGDSFPIQELSSLRELETLDMSDYGFKSSPTLNGTMSNLLHLDLSYNNFFSVDDVMRSMDAFPSLRSLSLGHSFQGGRLFELPNLPNLEVLDLSWNGFNGTLPMEAFQHLEVLDLTYNFFVGGIPSTIKSLSSLKAISLAGNALNESLSLNGLCELKNLHEIDLGHNMFDGNLSYCFSRLSSLKLFDISSNRFTGILLPSLFANLTSLEYIDFSRNQFEGIFPLSTFSNHKMLNYVAFISDNDKFQVETEEPIGWTPMFQLTGLVLSNCKINEKKGSVALAFLLHQHKLKVLDLSHNSLDGRFPSWLIHNNPMSGFPNLRNNSFANTFCLPFYGTSNMKSLDISSNHIIGEIPRDIQKAFPNIIVLNLSRNSLEGIIPSSVGDFRRLEMLDLSYNELSGEVPASLFRNDSKLEILKLSSNSLSGNILSGNINFRGIIELQLDSNCFTGEIGNNNTLLEIQMLDISNNFFRGVIPGWVGNISSLRELVVRNNTFGGQFPCGTAPFEFLDISENYFSGPITSCLNSKYLKHAHLGSNKFTGLIPHSFSNLTDVLTLDIGNNNLSGQIPEFLGELTNLRILLLRKNSFTGSIPKELCQLTNASLIDLSGNFLSGSIPRCLQYITGPSDQAFTQTLSFRNSGSLKIEGGGALHKSITQYNVEAYAIQDEVLLTTKALFLLYKGGILDLMSGLDLSCNQLTGVIPEELGLLSQIHFLNLSHNRLTGPIPAKFSNLAKIESLDLSFNRLTGQVPSELIKLHSLAVFDVSFNNLSGRLPEMKGQLSTFEKESYKGNPLLCGLPLEKKCTTESHGTHPSDEEESDEKWYDIDIVSYYASSSSIWLGLVLGFAAVLYVDHYWRRRWLDFVEDCMYACYFFLFELGRKVSMLFRK